MEYGCVPRRQCVASCKSFCPAVSNGALVVPACATVLSAAQPVSPAAPKSRYLVLSVAINYGPDDWHECLRALRAVSQACWWQVSFLRVVARLRLRR